MYKIKKGKKLIAVRESYVDCLEFLRHRSDSVGMAIFKDGKMILNNK